MDREALRLPSVFNSVLNGADVYDSSCSKEASVLFIDKECGYYLKSAAKGALSNEAIMADYFHKKGLSAPVLEYISLERDYLLTERVVGEDCTYKAYLDEPERLAALIGENLAMLHSLDFSDCPIKNRISTYFEVAEENYKKGVFDQSFYHNSANPDEVWRIVCDLKGILKCDALLHGDYCLPNIMVKDWKLSGFIDLGNGGVGDKHIDLFWGAWTLNFNLGTDKYRDVFFDAYGRSDIDIEIINAVGAAECFG